MANKSWNQRIIEERNNRKNGQSRVEDILWPDNKQKGEETNEDNR